MRVAREYSECNRVPFMLQHVRVIEYPRRVKSEENILYLLLYVHVRAWWCTIVIVMLVLLIYFTVPLHKLSRRLNDLHISRVFCEDG